MGRTEAKMLIIDNFIYGNAIYSLQVEKNRYISSLQIYLDSVKWKIFVIWVTKHFQVVKKGSQRGQNANYRQFHYVYAIYSLQIGVKKGAKMLIIDNFTTVMPYIRCKLNKVVIYRHYRYTWTVWNEKYSLLE